MSFDTPTELERLIIEHARRYPQMLPQDAVKLLYQRNFGPGHMISTAEDALERLRDERRRIAAQPSIPLLETLGNGLARLNLNSPDAQGIRDEKIISAFMKAAALKAAGADSFMRELGELSGLCAAGSLPFEQPALSEYLRTYEADGYPLVSHSERYRRLYAPAYRVIAVG